MLPVIKFYYTFNPLEVDILSFIIDNRYRFSGTFVDITEGIHRNKAHSSNTRVAIMKLVDKGYLIINNRKNHHKYFFLSDKFFSEFVDPFGHESDSPLSSHIPKAL